MTFTYTEEEQQYIKNFVETFTQSKNGLSAYKKIHRVVIQVLNMNMDRYGEDGMGDKPKDMNRVLYWLPQLYNTINKQISK